MNSRKLFFGLVAVLIIISGGGVAALVLGDKMLTQENNRLSEFKAEANSLETVQNSLINAKKDIANFSPIEQITRTVVPQEKDQAKTVREIIKLAGESKISIASVTFPSSNLGTKAVPGATQSPTASTGGTTQTQKVEGISNVERLEITVTSDTTKPVPYTNFLQLLEKLEQNRRTSQVSSINIQPVAGNRNSVTFTLIINVYIKK